MKTENMKPIPTKEQRPNGLHQRFRISKIVNGESVPVHAKAEYFVLRLDNYGSDPNHIAACRKAIHTYADAIEATIPELAKDLRERYPL